MTPKSFDIDTCKEIVGDARMRVLEAEARQDADAGTRKGFIQKGENYWARVLLIMEYVVYTTAYDKRLERIRRMKEKNNV